MENITQSIELDLSSQTSFYVVEAMQGDRNSRFLNISLMNNNEKYMLPKGLVIRLMGHRPDGKAILEDCTYDYNIITCELSEYILNVSGTAECKIGIFDSENNKLLSSASFKIRIPENPFDENAVIETDEFSSLTNALNNIESAIESANQLVVTANTINKEWATIKSEVTTAKDDAANVVASASSALATVGTAISDMDSLNKEVTEAENERIANETTRVSSENARVTNENNRIDNEKNRATAESLRLSNEEARVQAENERVAFTKELGDAVASESERVNAEKIRVEAEKERVSAETLRATNETKREESFTTAINNSTKATERANVAAEACESIVLGTGYLVTAEKGAANGIATLDDDKLLPTSQLPIVPIEKGGTGAATLSGALSNLGLDKISNTSDSEKNVLSASKLTTARTIGLINGVTGTAVSFDGSTNIVIPVTAVDPEYLSSAVPITNGGTGAITASEALANLGALPISGGHITGNLQVDGTVTFNDNTFCSGTMQCEGLTVDGNQSMSGTLTVAGLITANGGIKGDLTGNSTTATKLATARSISITGGAVASAKLFDGSASISLSVKSLDPTKLSTAVDITKGGTGATTVAAARTKLAVPFGGQATLTSSDTILSWASSCTETTQAFIVDTSGYPSDAPRENEATVICYCANSIRRTVKFITYIGTVCEEYTRHVYNGAWIGNGWMNSSDVAYGGTGATTKSGARTNLGCFSGSSTPSSPSEGDTWAYVG